MDLDLLPPRLLILLTDLDLLDEHHRQLPGEGLQLQQFPGLGHDLFLIAGLLLTGELLIDLGQPPLQAALFLQEVLVQLHKLPFTEHTGNLSQVQVFQGRAPLFQLGVQGALLQQQGLPVVVLWRRELQLLQMVVGPDVVPDALGNHFYQPVQPDGVAGAQLLRPAVGIKLTAKIIYLRFPLFPVGGLAHGAAAVHALHKASQGMHHAGAVLPGADV